MIKFCLIRNLQWDQALLCKWDNRCLDDHNKTATLALTFLFRLQKLVLQHTSLLHCIMKLWNLQCDGYFTGYFSTAINHSSYYGKINSRHHKKVHWCWCPSPPDFIQFVSRWRLNSILTFVMVSITFIIMNTLSFFFFVVCLYIIST